MNICLECGKKYFCSDEIDSEETETFCCKKCEEAYWEAVEDNALGEIP